MSDQHINLMGDLCPPDPQQKYNQRRGKKYNRFVIKAFIFIIILSTLFFANIMFSRDSLLTNFGRMSFWQGVAKVVVGKDNILKGEINDRINILILGMGGAEHEGPYLTDTIILASIKPSTKQIALLSIPRDLYVPVPGHEWRKINSANALGMAGSRDGGALTSKVIENIFDLDVHYWVRIDFNMFTQLIDELGGIELYVEKGFIDHSFPGPNFSFQALRFDKGLQIMDGNRALKFARSRHGTNDEGSDFARARRQQKVLFAIKDKIANINLLSKPHMIGRLYSVLKYGISTNLGLNQGIQLVKLAASVDAAHIFPHVIETGENGLLSEEITLSGAYVLRPKSGDFKDLAQLAHNILDLKSPKTDFGKYASSINSSSPSQFKPPKIIILNGTYINGLATQYSQKLTNAGFMVASIGNAIDKHVPLTTVYDISQQDDLSQTFYDLASLINAQAKNKLPADIRPYFSNTDADFLIILGSQ